MKQAYKRKPPADEFTKAGKRILKQAGFYGGPRPCALAWILAFAKDPLADLGAGGWTDLWNEVQRFAVDGGLGEGRLVHVRLQLPVRFQSPFSEQRTDAWPGAREFIKMLQEVVLTILKRYVRGGEMRMNGQKIDLVARRDVPGMGVIGADLPTGFFYHLFDLVGDRDLGPRIKQCRCCERLFLAGRTDKEFCSGLCQAKTYKREHTKTKRKKGR